MKRFVLQFVFVVMAAVFVYTAQPVTAAVTRYATCDACGLCPKIINGKNPSCTVSFVPGDWTRCVKCLYPNKFPKTSTPDPKTCETLMIDDVTNQPKFPITKGRQFTMLGCISAGTSVGFSDQKGAPSFVQAMLNVVFSLTGGIAFLYLMYGGFTILTSQANPEKLNYGWRLVYGAIVGVILTLGSVFIINLVGAGILRIPGFGGP